MNHHTNHTGVETRIALTAEELVRKICKNELVSLQTINSQTLLTCEGRSQPNTAQYTRYRTSCGRHVDRHLAVKRDLSSRANTERSTQRTLPVKAIPGCGSNVAVSACGVRSNSQLNLALN